VLVRVLAWPVADVTRSGAGHGKGLAAATVCCIACVCEAAVQQLAGVHTWPVIDPVGWQL